MCMHMHHATMSGGFYTCTIDAPEEQALPEGGGGGKASSHGSPYQAASRDHPDPVVQVTCSWRSELLSAFMMVHCAVSSHA